MDSYVKGEITYSDQVSTADSMVAYLQSQNPILVPVDSLLIQLLANSLRKQQMTAKSRGFCFQVGDQQIEELCLFLPETLPFK